MTTMQLFLLLLTANLFFIISHAANEADRVLSLPYFDGQLPFKMYAGYLNASDSSRLFYIYIEAEELDPSVAPITAWYNGGPGVFICVYNAYYVQRVCSVCVCVCVRACVCCVNLRVFALSLPIFSLSLPFSFSHRIIHVNTRQHRLLVPRWLLVRTWAIRDSRNRQTGPA